MSYYESQLEKVPHIEIFKKYYPNFKYGGRFGLRVSTDINPTHKQDFISECNKRGLCVEDEYIPLLHLEEFFVKHGAKNLGTNVFKETEDLYKSLISLPIFYKGDHSVINAYIEDFYKISRKYTN